MAFIVPQLTQLLLLRIAGHTILLTFTFVHERLAAKVKPKVTSVVLRGLERTNTWPWNGLLKNTPKQVAVVNYQ